MNHRERVANPWTRTRQTIVTVADFVSDSLAAIFTIGVSLLAVYGIGFTILTLSIPPSNSVASLGVFIFLMIAVIIVLAVAIKLLASWFSKREREWYKNKRG